MATDCLTEALLGFDFGGTKVMTGVARRSDGRLLTVRRFLTTDYPDAAALVQAALDQAHRWASAYQIVAVGAATMGVEQDGRVALAPNLPGWEADPLTRGRLSAEFPGLPCQVANDVKAALEAECQWGRLVGVSYGAYLNLGTGVALAFARHGQVWEGAHGMAGEVAYTWRRGEPGWALGRAPLEDCFGGHALSGLPAEQWRERVDELGYWIGQWLLLLDVDRLVMGGGWARRAVESVPTWQAEWRQYLPAQPEVVLSMFPDTAGLRGAFAVAARLVP